MSDVVLVVNPAQSGPGEASFWRSAASALKARGHRLVQMVRKTVPENPDAVTIRIPVRLSDWRPLAIAPPREPPAWTSEDRLEMLEEWEALKLARPQRSADSAAGLRKAATFVDAAVRLLRPRVVLTHNKILDVCFLFRAAAGYYGSSAPLVERSPLGGIVLEPEGMYAESRIWRDYPEAQAALTAEHARIGAEICARIAANPANFRTDGASEAAANPADRPVFFLPMDHAVGTGWVPHAHPQRPMDSPLFDTPFEAMADLAERIASLGGSLRIKTHPSCRLVTAENVPDGATFHTGSLAEALAAADVVLTFNTTVAYPALAMGKPVVTLAPDPVACSGATYHCLERGGVADALKQALDRIDLDARLARFAPFVGWLAREVFYECEPSGQHPRRGPAEFVEDLLAAAPQDAATMPARDADRALRRLAAMVAVAPPPEPLLGRVAGGARRIARRLVGRR